MELMYGILNSGCGIKIKILRNGMNFYKEKNQIDYSCSHEAIKPELKGTDKHYWVTLGEGCDITFYAYSWDRSISIANALYTLKNKAAGYYEAEATFPAVAKGYREAPVKPTLSEESRKFKIQAEYAIEQKRFEDAANCYDDALKIAPWWPEGHFNRALILSEIKQYEEAVAEMKKYLALVPDAPDARAGQDKIYQWESMAK